MYVFSAVCVFLQGFTVIVTPSKIKIKTVQWIKSRMWEVKEGKFAKISAKIRVIAIVSYASIPVYRALYRDAITVLYCIALPALHCIVSYCILYFIFFQFSTTLLIKKYVTKEERSTLTITNTVLLTICCYELLILSLKGRRLPRTKEDYI